MNPVRACDYAGIFARLAWVFLSLLGLADSGLRTLQQHLRQQRQEELESVAIGGRGVELNSSGKQCCLIKALKALCLAFSRLSCKISLSSCFIRSTC